jgi:hypothetical protein
MASPYPAGKVIDWRLALIAFGLSGGGLAWLVPQLFRGPSEPPILLFCPIRWIAEYFGRNGLYGPQPDGLEFFSRSRAGGSDI